MSKERIDAWTENDDLLLAESVLRHIREGSTQLKAFDEVGQILNRTASACGFRWNGFVRKTYQSAIDLAKKQRRENKRKIESEEKSGQSVVTKHSVHTPNNYSHLTVDEQNDTLLRENEELRQENLLLEQHLKIANEKLQFIEQDYQIISAIIQRGKEVLKAG